MKTILTIFLLLLLAYLTLSFVTWEFNPAHWSAIARAVLLIVFVLTILKPIADAINGRNSANTSDSFKPGGRTNGLADQSEQIYRGTTSIRG